MVWVRLGDSRIWHIMYYLREITAELERQKINWKTLLVFKELQGDHAFSLKSKNEPSQLKSVIKNPIFNSRKKKNFRSSYWVTE